jgi:hypothetical protein
MESFEINVGMRLQTWCVNINNKYNFNFKQSEIKIK